MNENTHNKTVLNYIKTPWATPCLILNGYMYNCHSKRGNRGYWRCHNYSKKQAELRCRARCVVVDDLVQSMTGGPHNHLPHKDKIEKFMRRSEMFEDIKEDLDIVDCKEADAVNLADFLAETDDENTLMLEAVLV